MIKIDKYKFGLTNTGEVVNIYKLKGNDIVVKLSEYGANIISIKVPDKDGLMKDVVLGYDSLAAYENQDKYIGATVGRCCNRIKYGEFELEGEKFPLFCNDGKNHLHGGRIGFDKKVWKSEVITNGIKFFYHSPDSEEGYPGNLDVEVIYTLKDKTLNINYIATCDKDTICSLTNHSYFNLSGFDSGNVLQQKVQILADSFTENDEYSIPTGQIISVENTPMDFRQLKSIGNDINSEYYQIKFANGFDNNWCIKDYDDKLRKAAYAISEQSGICLEVLTDMPGVQFYSGNFLDGAQSGKNNSQIKNHYGFCLECQNFPDAVHHKNFPQPVLRLGEIYNKTIQYRFI